MSAVLQPVKAWSEIEICDALSVEIVPMLDALALLARFSGALRDAAAAVESDPALGLRLRAAGVDVADLLDQPPETMLAGFAWAIRLRAAALAKGGNHHG